MSAALKKSLQKVAAIGAALFLIMMIVGCVLIKDYIFAGVLALAAVINLLTTLIPRNRTLPSFPASCCMIFLLGLSSYQRFVRYEKETCQDRLGLPFNKEREKTGVPILPTGWKITRGIKSVDWDNKDTTTWRHQYKSVFFGNGCQINHEYDDYELPDSDDSKRGLRVTTKYSKSGKPDSILFYYRLGDSSMSVTRKFADSLLTADQIRKDF